MNDAITGPVSDGSLVDAELLENAALRAITYLRHAPSRRVAPLPSAVHDLRQLSVAFPDAPLSPNEVLDRLDRIGSPATVTNQEAAISGSSSAARSRHRWLRHGWRRHGIRTFLSA